MTAITWSLLAGALTVFSVACAAVLVVVVVLRATRQVRARRADRARAHVRPAVLAVLAADDDDLHRAVDDLLSLPRSQWPAAERFVLRTLAEVRGESRDALVGVLVNRGKLRRVLRASKARSAVTRARAAEGLGLLAHSDARRRLMQLMADPARDVRIVAVRALGSLEDPALTAIILSALHPRIDVPASVVGTALLRAGSADVEALRQGLDSSHAPLRATAVAVAGHLLLTELTEPVSWLLDRDPSLLVRDAAGRALVRLGYEPEVPSATDSAPHPPARPLAETAR